MGFFTFRGLHRNGLFMRSRIKWVSRFHDLVDRTIAVSMAGNGWQVFPSSFSFCFRGGMCDDGSDMYGFEWVKKTYDRVENICGCEFLEGSGNCFEWVSFHA